MRKEVQQVKEGRGGALEKASPNEGARGAFHLCRPKTA